MEKKIENALTKQVNAELWSAYLYLSMSLHADAKGWKGTANWMYVQWLEEQDHARILQRYLLSRNKQVKLLPIESVPTEWNTMRSMFDEALKQEKEVTKKIHELMMMAKECDDFATCNCLNWFVDEQVEEEESVGDVLDVFDLIGGSGASLAEYDRHLLRREYHQAEPLKC